MIEELPDDDKEPPPPPPDIRPRRRRTCRRRRVSVETRDRHGPELRRFQQRDERAPGGTAASAAVAAPKPVERARSSRTPPSTQGRGARITQPEYPPAARRAGEEGTVTLKVFVTEGGRAGQVEVAKSSGFPKLDEAAVKEVQRNWRFVPGKEDGNPVSMWHTFAVTFRLTD
jgi:periplasmic protein TonB